MFLECNQEPSTRLYTEYHHGMAHASRSGAGVHTGRADELRN